LGESNLASEFPFVKVAIDSFKEILFRSPVYKDVPLLIRLPFAAAGFCSSFLSFYGKVYPFILGGRVKRFVYKIFGIPDKGSIIKKRTLSVSENRT